MHRLVEFAYKHWKLPQPKMIISITGGAGDLKMDKKLKDGLKKGLMKVAVSTGQCSNLDVSEISGHRLLSHMRQNVVLTEWHRILYVCVSCVLFDWAKNNTCRILLQIRHIIVLFSKNPFCCSPHVR